MPRVKATPKRKPDSAKALKQTAAMEHNGNDAATVAPQPNGVATTTATDTVVMANGDTGHAVPEAVPSTTGANGDSSTPLHPKKRNRTDPLAINTKAKTTGAITKGMKKNKVVTKTKNSMLAKANALKRMGATAGAAAAAAAAGATSESGKKKRRWRQGTVALREIRQQQKLVSTVIPDAPFMRLVREVILENAMAPDLVLKMTRDAYRALKESAESYLIDLFRDAQTSAVSHGREAIHPRDFRLTMKLRGEIHKYPKLAPHREHFVS